MTMELVDMKLTPEEDKEKDGDEGAPEAPEGPEYPWGLCINLGPEELKKLGIEELPEVGAEIHIDAQAKVTSISEREDDERRVELQITAIHLNEGGEAEEDNESLGDQLRRLADKSETPKTETATEEEDE